MKYEIINPSDPYTIEAEDICVAAICCVLLGAGQYALEALEDGGEGVPLFMFGGFEEWWDAHSGEDVEYFRAERSEEIAAAMESVTLTSGERSSMNDIGARAAAFAENIRKGEGGGPKAPQQVFAR